MGKRIKKQYGVSRTVSKGTSSSISPEMSVSISPSSSFSPEPPIPFVSKLWREVSYWIRLHIHRIKIAIKALTGGHDYEDDDY